MTQTFEKIIGSLSSKFKMHFALIMNTMEILTLENKDMYVYRDIPCSVKGSETMKMCINGGPVRLIMVYPSNGILCNFGK